MTLEKFLLWFTVMAPLAYSAGPNNILCASIGSRFGIKHAIPFIAGMNTTVLFATLVVGFCFSALMENFPGVFKYIKYAGSAFILILALKFFKTFHLKDEEAKRQLPGFFQGFLLNLLNPKAVMALAVMYSQFLDSDAPKVNQVFILTVLTVVVSISAHFLWVSGGNWLRLKFQSARAANAQRYVFTSMLAIVAVVLLFI